MAAPWWQQAGLTPAPDWDLAVINDPRQWVQFGLFTQAGELGQDSEALQVARKLFPFAAGFRYIQLAGATWVQAFDAAGGLVGLPINAAPVDRGNFFVEAVTLAVAGYLGGSALAAAGATSAPTAAAVAGGAGGGAGVYTGAVVGSTSGAAAAGGAAATGGSSGGGAAGGASGAAGGASGATGGATGATGATGGTAAGGASSSGGLVSQVGDALMQAGGQVLQDTVTKAGTAIVGAIVADAAPQGPANGNPALQQLDGGPVRAGQVQAGQVQAGNGGALLLAAAVALLAVVL